jgi:hypothetical protein
MRGRKLMTPPSRDYRDTSPFEWGGKLRLCFDHNKYADREAANVQCFP